MSEVSVKVEPAGPCRLRLAIEVPATEVDTAWRAVVEQFAQGARLPGFRPGRAPRELVQKKFARQIEEDLRDHLIRVGYREALKKEGLQVVAPLEVTDETPLLSGASFGFRVTVDVAPRFELPAWKGVTLEARPMTVTDAEVEDAIGRMRERLARFVPVEGRAVTEGDLVRIDYEGRTGETPLSELASSCPDAASGRDQWIAVETAEDFLPGLKAVLIGMGVGGTKELNVVFPADYRVKELAGCQALYTVTVKEIREKQLPPLDGEFFSAVKVADEAEFRQRMRQLVEEEKREEEKRRRRQTLIRWLLDHTPMEELPQSELDAETRSSLNRLVQENIRRGVSEETLREHSDTLLEAAAASSRDRVRLDYILSRIADQEAIEATEEEINVHLSVLARMRRESLAKVRAEVEERGTLAEIRESIRRNKALERVMEQVLWNESEQGSTDAQS